MDEHAAGVANRKAALSLPPEVPAIGHRDRLILAARPGEQGRRSPTSSFPGHGHHEEPDHDADSRPDVTLVLAGTDLDQAQRRTVRVLSLTQLCGGVGLAAGVAVGALLARDLLGGDALAGLPSALSTLGGALATLPLARLMGAHGRRPGLAAGYLLGAVGCLIVVTAATTRSFALLLLGMACFGVGNTTGLLARYAAADLAPAEQRGRATGTVLFATTFGAVAGPTLLEPMGAVAETLGLPRLSGPFLLSLCAYAVAATVVATLLRPDPLLLAREAALSVTTGPVLDRTETRDDEASAWRLLVRGDARSAVVAMVAAQLVMVSMMTMTPVHMVALGFTLGPIGVVISAHLAGMYLLSPLSGMLVDRLGAHATIGVGAVVLALAGTLGMLAADSGMALLTAALFLLGLGWSLALVAASSLLTGAVSVHRRAAVQGRADLLLGLAGTVGGVGSGLVLALAGYATIALVVVVVALALLGVGLRRPG